MRLLIGQHSFRRSQDYDYECKCNMHLHISKILNVYILLLHSSLIKVNISFLINNKLSFDLRKSSDTAVKPRMNKETQRRNYISLLIHFQRTVLYTH